MRILHVGSGFRPWRRGGLVAYVEDLMEAQVEHGHQVSYVFSGRQYPWLRWPRLRRWERGGVAMLEIVNSPLFDHGRQPELELAEPRIEAILATILRDVRPDVVHVQELAGLPSSLLDAVRAAGVPTVMTLQDYFPLCPTFKLLDASGHICLRSEIGADCVATTAANPRDPGLLFDATIRYDLTQSTAMLRFTQPRRDRLIERWARAAAARAPIHDTREAHAEGVDDLARAFQRRRDVNVARLSRVDRLIAMSPRVAEIYAHLGVAPGQLGTLQLTLAHIERLTPRRRAVTDCVTFATLAALESTAKGGQVLLDAVRLLSAAAEAGRFRVLVFGSAEATFLKAAETVTGIEIRGPYGHEQLDSLLEDIDVGLLTSVWEEAYGFAGIEFLAKGIPVIANAIGGMTDYTREGHTGWLNRSCSAEELAQIMLSVIDRPAQIDQLSERISSSRGSIVKSMRIHADEMNAVYEDIVAAPVSDVRPVSRSWPREG